MKIGNEIIHALKSNPPDDATERVIFIEVLKANPDYETNIVYLENEASRWPLEHLAVAMMFKATTLLLDRLTELTPSERPAAVTKIIQAMLTTHHVESYSHYAEKIIRICAICFATLSREFTSEIHSLIISVHNLLRSFANRLPPKDAEEADDFAKGFDLGDLSNTNKINDELRDAFSLNLNFNVLKGYVYRRVMDWIKVMPDRELAAQMASALSKSFNISVPDTTD
jgi:hypothetical protein